MKTFKIDNIYCKSSFCNNMKSIVIYCHGFESNKDRMNQHVNILNENNIGIISFDFPTHGEDKTKFEDFTIELGLNYIDEIVNYLKTNYPNIPISFIGSSFGGYMVLNYINQTKTKYHKIFLKYPAVNFYECIKRKLHIDDKYFDNQEYFELPSGYRIYKNSYLSTKKYDIMNNFNKYNNDIYIIHGDIDKTVLVEDVIKFCNQNNIKLNIFDGASHGMEGYQKEVNEELIKHLI